MPAKSEPALARAQMRLTRREHRADLRTAQNPADHSVVVPARNDHRHARILRDLCRLDFRLHTARPLRRSGTACQPLNRGRDLRNLIHQLCRRVCTWIRRINAVNVRQDDQGIRVDERRDHCRERIVVADLDLIHSNCIILINDRNSPH